MKIKPKTLAVLMFASLMIGVAGREGLALVLADGASASESASALLVGSEAHAATSYWNGSGGDMWNTQSGWTGIGTSNPVSKLEINDWYHGVATSLRIHPNFLDSSRNTQWVTLDIPGDKGLRIWDKMSVASGVGIGTPTTNGASLFIKAQQSWGDAIMLDSSSLNGGRKWKIESSAGDHKKGQKKFLVYDQNKDEYRLIIRSGGGVCLGSC